MPISSLPTSMMNKKIGALAMLLLLAACAHAPRASVEQPALADATADAATENGMVLPKLELNDQLLYQFLLADIAAQRGQHDLAVQIYLELARTTRDPRVARRAAQLAYESHQMKQALEAFRLWQDVEPTSLLAKQMLATLLVSGGRLEEAQSQIAGMLAADPENAGRALMQLFPLFARHPDKVSAFKTVRELARPYPQFAESHWVVAQAAEAAAMHDAALAEAGKARALRPEWDMGALLEAQLLLRDTPQQALTVLKKFLADYPDSNEVRLFYARALLEQKQYPEARLEFQQLQKQHPDNAELAFAVALLSLQMGELDRAEQELQQTLRAGKKDNATVYYYLAQLNEAKKKDDLALQQYRLVRQGEYVFPSRLRMAYLLNKNGKLKEAREVLHQTEVQHNQERAQLLLIEAQLLRDARQYEAAAQVLTQGLEKFPDNQEMLYEAAMVADKQGKTEVFEGYIRKLIKIAPAHAHAYNALGYSLLERNVRLHEGMNLVEKAYQLSPDDAAIMDSMGWGYYRLGDLPKSLEFLRRAYAAYPDPEVAAHLGEVLWQSGARDEAKKVWQDSLQEHPESAPLRAVVKKFVP
jgi:tetratricopeptide (TPR) repeat protein